MLPTCAAAAAAEAEESKTDDPWGPPDLGTSDEWTCWRADVWVLVAKTQRWERYCVLWFRFLFELLPRLHAEETAGLYTLRRVYLEEWVWTEECGWREKDHV